MGRSVVLVILGACGSTPPPASGVDPPAVVPDAAIVIVDAPPPPPVLVVEEEFGEEELELWEWLDAHPFSFLRQRRATVAMTVYYNQVAPEVFGGSEGEVSAVALPGGPSLVCVGGECWGIEGEMTGLWVPDDDRLLGAAPHLTVIAEMPDQGRVAITVNLDDPDDHLATPEPARDVERIDVAAPPAWAEPWLDWFALWSGADIVAGAQPVPHVFIGAEEDGVLCVARDGRHACSEPVPTGAGQGEVSYAPGTLAFGSSIAVSRTSELTTDDDSLYVRADTTLLFDASGAALPWIATVPGSVYARIPDDPDETLPLLDLWLAWTEKVVGSCIQLTRTKNSAAERYVPDEREHEGVGVRKAKLPRLAKPKRIARDVTPDQLVERDFAGKWRVDDGGLARAKRCP